jgi:hypothetical protein
MRAECATVTSLVSIHCSQRTSRVRWSESKNTGFYRGSFRNDLAITCNWPGGTTASVVVGAHARIMHHNDVQAWQGYHLLRCCSTIRAVTASCVQTEVSLRFLEEGQRHSSDKRASGSIQAGLVAARELAGSTKANGGHSRGRRSGGSSCSGTSGSKRASGRPYSGSTRLAAGPAVAARG